MSTKVDDSATDSVSSDTTLDIVSTAATDSKQDSNTSLHRLIDENDLFEPFVWRTDSDLLEKSLSKSSIPEIQEIKIDRLPEDNDFWLLGGKFGSPNATLMFRSSALANASEASVHSKPAYKLHITYRVSQAETKLLSKLLDCHGVTEVTNSNNFNLLWTGCHPKPGTLRAMAPHQRVNHFPRSYELTRKDRLYKNIERMQHSRGFKHFDFIPQTFVMPSEFRDLCSTHYRIKGPWIVKPVASSRGRGIFIVENPNQVPLDEPVVVAKYINKPLLVEGHKCDLRLYVLVTSMDPLLVYIYEEGLVRLATVRYDSSHKQLWNPCMHLCNYSINKYHSDYVKSDDPSAENVGHKWTLSALLRHLKAQGKDTALLMAQIEDVVVKAMISSASAIVPACQMFVPYVYNCFELYGFDILIDENLKPWLLEVNLSPSLGCDTPLDVRLKSAMLSDLLTLVGIPAIDPILRSSKASVTTSNSSVKSNSLKMKLSNCRRVHSADGLNHKKGGPLSKTSVMLTTEEVKLLRHIKSEFERRGGFVRIFPTVDSWAKYSLYLDPVTGVPTSGTPQSTYNLLSQHNYNQMLFTQLFPDVSIHQNNLKAEKSYHYDRKKGKDYNRCASAERGEKDKGVPQNRQDRYERMLSQGHRAALLPKKLPIIETHCMELTNQVTDALKNGRKLTQAEARKTFSQYLSYILKRIAAAPEQEGHVEIVLKFLQKASNYLRTPFVVKFPSHQLLDKDRAAIVAKQLNEFLGLYNKETEMYSYMLDRPSQLPSKLFEQFLEHARESDLEEVLMCQSVEKPGKPLQSSLNNRQGILKCLPNISNKNCFRIPMTRRNTVKVSNLS